MNCTTRILKTILNVGVSKYMYYPNILNFASNRISNKFQFDLLGTNYTHTKNMIQMKITLPQLNITHIPFDIWIEGLWSLLAGWLLAGWLTKFQFFVFFEEPIYGYMWDWRCWLLKLSECTEALININSNLKNSRPIRIKDEYCSMIGQTGKYFTLIGYSCFKYGSTSDEYSVAICTETW